MIRTRKIWAVYCEGCLAEYCTFGNKEAAEKFATEFPLCDDCDGEGY